VRIAVMPPVAVGASIVPDRVFYADVPRGCDLGDVVEIAISGGLSAKISGAELRAALLATSHPAPWRLGFVGAERYALQLDPDGRCAIIAHLDARGLANPKYWLYRRGDDGAVKLTRWTRAGYIPRRRLLEEAGIDASLLTKTATKNAFSELARKGLPDQLQLRPTPRGTAETLVRAPQPGWLDIPPGTLNVDSDRVPVHEVDDLGEWPFRVEQGSD
jgi:hypothetical protein